MLFWWCSLGLRAAKSSQDGGGHINDTCCFTGFWALTSTTKQHTGEAQLDFGCCSKWPFKMRGVRYRGFAPAFCEYRYIDIYILQWTSPQPMLYPISAAPSCSVSRTKWSRVRPQLSSLSSARNGQLRAIVQTCGNACENVWEFPGFLKPMGINWNLYGSYRFWAPLISIDFETYGFWTGDPRCGGNLQPGAGCQNLDHS